MAVFVSASDESDGGHHRSRFWHGGWIAPENDWTKYFVPAWQERVLDAKPKIPFMHMTDIRGPEWLMEHGLTWDQAQDKMDEAARVIDQTGSLYPFVIDVDAGAFLDAHGTKKIMESVDGKKAARFLVDHYCFNVYVFGVLNYIHIRHPETEKVDFVVERKEGVFEKIKQFYEGLGASITQLGHPELTKYLGELIPAGKDRIPVQAADMLLWHASRDDLGMLKGRDRNRRDLIFNRQGKRIPLPDEVHFQLAHSLKAKLAELEGINESKRRVRKLRPHDAGANASPKREIKGRPRSRKSAKASKKAKG